MTDAAPIAVMRPKLPELSALEPYLRQIDDSGVYSNLGPLAIKLEARLARRYGVASEQIITTSNGTSALQIAFLAAKTQGRYCLMPSWTFVATPHSALSAGLEPYFLDVDPDTQQLSIDAVRDAITTLGVDQIGAICLVSAFGAPIDAAPWEALQDETGLSVVVDAAAAFVTLQASKLISCISLHATKILPAGEGGFILCPSLDFAGDARPRTNFGFWNSRKAGSVSTNAKMSEYHAAIAHASLDTWHTRRAAYMDIAKRYRARLDLVDGVRLPSGFAEDWFNSVVVVRLSLPEGDACKAWLEADNIYTRRWWGAGCHTQPAFANAPRGDLRVSEQLAAETIGLPCHTQLEDADIDRICASLGAFLVEKDAPPLKRSAA
ncbi:MAG: aminotransferase class I/II-fold pyridoxal phosphate-dependent enzyme [Pseudomonadota bacterium]